MIAESIKKPRSLRKGASINNRLSSHTAALALGVSSMACIAQEPNQAEDSSKEIELVEVYGVKAAPYKASRSGDDRRPMDLADLPQTLTILTQTQIADSGKSDLKDILSAQSGVTLGTGENGNAFGDRYIIRGHEARSDVFVDGIRDPGMTTRESFATEQIEITKGPSSTFAGRGSSGGAINSITKQANLDKSFAILQAGIGANSFHRVTIDANKNVNDNFALRANLLHAEEDIANRSPAEKDRVGGLISARWQSTEKLGFLLDYYHLQADDTPDLGSYFDQNTRSPVEDIPVYFQKGDFLDTQVDSLTFKTEYDISGNLRWKNVLRGGTTDNGYVATGIRGTTRADTDTEAPGLATATLSTHQGWQEVEYLVNQLNVFWDVEYGNTEHNWVFGFEYSDELVNNGVFETVNTAENNCITIGRRGDSENICAIDASGNYLPNLNTLLGREVTRGEIDSIFDVKTLSIYLMDNVKLSQKWSAFWGLRYDSFEYDNTVINRNTRVETPYAYSDGFSNGHLGFIHHFSDYINAYLTYSTATNINGGESDLGSNCGYGGLCGTPEQVESSVPEQVRNIELGTKWELFDERVLMSAALFHMVKHDVMESVGDDDYASLGTLNTGKNRVQGLEVSLTGAITEKLSAQLSASVMDAKILDSYLEENIGLSLSNFGDNHAYLQIRYDASDNFSFGGAVTYKSEMYGGQPDAAANYNEDIGDYNIVIPNYYVVDMFVNYYPTESINLRLNVSNVTDQEYWTAAYRSGAFMYLGEAINTRLNLTWNF